MSEAQVSLLVRANNLLAEAQTQNLTDRLANAIRNNEINMTEINNYAGEDGIPYFTERQIKELRDAWLDSAAAKNGAEFKVVTKLSENGELAADLGFSEEYIKSIMVNPLSLQDIRRVRQILNTQTVLLERDSLEELKFKNLLNTNIFPTTLKRAKALLWKKS